MRNKGSSRATPKYGAVSLAKAKLVLIEWVDSAGPAVGGWILLSDVKDDHKGIMVNRSVGWLIHEDKQTITLAASHGGDSLHEYNDQARGLVTIPLCAIRSRRVLG